MQQRRSFRFLDKRLNRKLIGLLRRAQIKHSVDEDGLIHYFERDIETVENDLICSLRTKVFPTWSLQTCPADWVESYRRYMGKRGIPFKEELSDGELWFLIPGRFRPLRWKLDPPVTDKVT